MPAPAEVFAQVFVVLDDAVVDEGHAAGAVAMRVGVGLGDGSGGGPAGMAKREAGRGQLGRVLAELADTVGAARGMVHADGYAPGVVTSVLKLFEAREYHTGDVFGRSGIAEYSTHEMFSL